MERVETKIRTSSAFPNISIPSSGIMGATSVSPANLGTITAGAIAGLDLTGKGQIVRDPATEKFVFKKDLSTSETKAGDADDE